MRNDSSLFGIWRVWDPRSEQSVISSGVVRNSLQDSWAALVINYFLRCHHVNRIPCTIPASCDVRGEIMTMLERSVNEAGGEKSS